MMGNDDAKINNIGTGMGATKTATISGRAVPPPVRNPYAKISKGKQQPIGGGRPSPTPQSSAPRVERATKKTTATATAIMNPTAKRSENEGRRHGGEKENRPQQQQRRREDKKENAPNANVVSAAGAGADGARGSNRKHEEAEHEVNTVNDRGGAGEKSKPTSARKKRGSATLASKLKSEIRDLKRAKKQKVLDRARREAEEKRRVERQLREERMEREKKEREERRRLDREERERRRKEEEAARRERAERIRNELIMRQRKKEEEMAAAARRAPLEVRECVRDMVSEAARRERAERNRNELITKQKKREEEMAMAAAAASRRDGHMGRRAPFSNNWSNPDEVVDAARLGVPLEVRECVRDMVSEVVRRGFFSSQSQCHRSRAAGPPLHHQHQMASSGPHNPPPPPFPGYGAVPGSFAVPGPSSDRRPPTPPNYYRHPQWQQHSNAHQQPHALTPSPSPPAWFHRQYQYQHQQYQNYQYDYYHQQQQQHHRHQYHHQPPTHPCVPRQPNPTSDQNHHHQQHPYVMGMEGHAGMVVPPPPRVGGGNGGGGANNAYEGAMSEAAPPPGPAEHAPPPTMQMASSSGGGHQVHPPHRQWRWPPQQMASMTTSRPVEHAIEQPKDRTPWQGHAAAPGARPHHPHPQQPWQWQKNHRSGHDIGGGGNVGTTLHHHHRTPESLMWNTQPQTPATAPTTSAPMPLPTPTKAVVQRPQPPHPRPSPTTMMLTLDVLEPVGISPWSKTHVVVDDQFVITRPREEPAGGGDFSGGGERHRRAGYGMDVRYELRRTWVDVEGAEARVKAEEGAKNSEVVRPEGEGSVGRSSADGENYDDDCAVPSASMVTAATSTPEGRGIVTTTTRAPPSTGVVAPVGRDGPGGNVVTPRQRPDPKGGDGNEGGHSPVERVVTTTASAAVTAASAPHFVSPNAATATTTAPKKGTRVEEREYAALVVVDPGRQRDVCGLRVGDVVLSINGVDVGGSSFADALRLAAAASNDGGDDRGGDDGVVRCVLRVARRRELLTTVSSVPSAPEDPSIAVAAGPPGSKEAIGGGDSRSAGTAATMIGASPSPPHQQVVAVPEKLVQKVPFLVDPSTNRVVSGEFTDTELRALVRGAMRWGGVTTGTIIASSRPLLGAGAIVDGAGGALIRRDAAAAERKWKHSVAARNVEADRRALDHWRVKWEREEGRERATGGFEGGGNHRILPPLTDAQRARMRAAPRPANGCRCGSTSHDRVDDPDCPLYRDVRVLLAATATADGGGGGSADDDDWGSDDDGETKRSGAAERVSYFVEPPSRKKRAAIIETGTERVRKRIRDEVEADQREAKFVHEMECRQLHVLHGGTGDDACCLAVFAPSLTVMVMSAVAELTERCSTRKHDAAARSRGNVEVRGGATSPQQHDDAREDDDDDDDDDDIPVAAIAASKTKNNPSSSVVTIVDVLLYISRTWGHVYEEPSHAEYSWRLKMHEMVTGRPYHRVMGSQEDEASWTSFGKNPRRPGSCSFEKVRFLFDDEAVRYLGGCSWLNVMVGRSNRKKHACGAAARVVPSLGRVSYCDGERSVGAIASSSIAPDDSSKRTDSLDPIQRRTEDELILVDAVSTSKTGLLDEITSLFDAGILRSTSIGHGLALTKKWWARVDPTVLSDMRDKWGEQIDWENKYAVHTSIRRKLSKMWTRTTENSWVRVDKNQEVFEDGAIRDSRNEFMSDFERFHDCEDGIGQFGI